jgi:hypothetical protein
MMEQTEKFDLWCVVELFGHQKMAGRCTEQHVAGVNMLRVDVPATAKKPAFTRLLSAGAIYAVNPVSEEIAKAVAENLQFEAITILDVRRLPDEKPKAIPYGDAEYNESSENDDLPW